MLKYIDENQERIQSAAWPSLIVGAIVYVSGSGFFEEAGRVFSIAGLITLLILLARRIFK